MRTNPDRRSFLKSAAIVTASSLLAANAHGSDEKQAPTLNAGPSPDPGKPKLVVAPPKACDCHAHIIGPGAKYPFVAGRSFTPVEAHLDQYRRMLSALGLQRAVIIQPSFYGTDNSRTHDAIAESHGNWRGVAGLVANTPKAEIQRLHDAGFRGARVNLSFKGGPTLEDLAKVALVVTPFGWHMQIQVEGRDLSNWRRDSAAWRRRWSSITWAAFRPSWASSIAGFQALLALVREGNTWVKLSSAYAMSKRPYPYDDIAPFAKALIEAGPNRVVWGSNWPHPSYKGTPPVDATQLDLLAYWAPEEMRKRILVDNPAKLYGFPSA